MRRGWYLGEPAFLDKLRDLVVPERKQREGGDSVARQHDQAEAEALAVRALHILGLPVGTKELSNLRKGDKNKVLVAALFRKRTSVGNRWLTDRLWMGNTSALSRLLGDFRKDPGNQRRLEDLEKMSK